MSQPRRSPTRPRSASEAIQERDEPGLSANQGSKAPGLRCCYLLEVTRLRLAASAAAALAAALIVACGPTKRPDGGEGLLPVGASVPRLEATDHLGQRVALAELGGKPVLVYFYPKDGTPGCTQEACAIRDTWDRFTEAELVVLGVSGDDAQSHREFAEDNALPFSLIPDPQLEWAAAFGVGTIGSFTARVSFLIGRDGKIAHVYPGVDPAVHADQVLTDARALP